MALKIKGITLEIGGDTQALSKSLSEANSKISKTQKALKDVDKLLKLDPTNIDLLKQREKLLNNEIEATKKKVDALKEAQRNMDAGGVDKTSDQYMVLQREIIAATQELDKLEAAAGKANSTMAQIGAAADKVASGANSVAKATRGLSTAAAGGLTAIGGMAYKAVTSADDLNTLAKQSGFTTAELQKMEYAADRIDVSMEDITSSAQRLKKNMGSTSGSIVDAFTRLGVSVQDQNGAMRDSADVYWDVIAALGQIENETERDQLAMTLLGKNADSLAGIIDDGGAAFRALGQEAEDAGLILSQDTLDSLNQVNDKIDQVKATAQATMATTGAKALEAAMPVIESLITAIGRVLEFIGGLSEGQMQVLIVILAIMAAISPLASLISGIASAVSFVATTVIPALSTALSFLAANPIVLVIAAIVAVIAAIVLFGDQIQEIIGKVDEWLQGVFVKDWTEIFGPTIGEILNGFFATVSTVWEGIKQILNGVIDFIKGIFTGDWERVWKGVVEIFDGIFQGIVAVAKAPINAVISLINSVINKINGFIRMANKVTSKVGITIGEIGSIPYLAKGGILSRGSAIVGEAGPELLTVAGGKSIVQPLTASVDTSGLKAAFSGIGGATQVNITFEGSLAQLGKVLQPVITIEEARRGPSLIKY